MHLAKIYLLYGLDAHPTFDTHPTYDLLFQGLGIFASEDSITSDPVMIIEPFERLPLIHTAQEPLPAISMVTPLSVPRSDIHSRASPSFLSLLVSDRPHFSNPHSPRVSPVLSSAVRFS